MRDIRIEETARILAALPTFGDGMVGLPNPEFPNLCCFFFFKGDSAKPDWVEALGWSVPRLQAVYYNMDKEYSRMASRAAILQLLDEINVRRDPQQAEQRFKSVVLMDPGVLLRSLPTAAA